MAKNRIQDPVIQVRELSVIFPNGNGGLQALDGISFDVCFEEFLCVLGPSGSGKSTLLRILAGLLPPTSGQVDYLDRPVLGPRREVGFVFQESNLMPWRTVLENIMLPLEIKRVPNIQAEARASEMVELVGLQGFEETLPRDLSGGMAQRVAIARALIHDPEVLLLDEPLSGLDAKTSRLVKDLLLLHAKKGGAVLFSTHIMEVAENICTRIGIIYQGKIVAEGTLDQLNTQTGNQNKTLEEVFLKLTNEENEIANKTRLLGETFFSNETA